MVFLREDILSHYASASCISHGASLLFPGHEGPGCRPQTFFHHTALSRVVEKSSMTSALIIFKCCLSKALHSQCYWKVTQSPLPSMEHWGWARSGWAVEGRGARSAAWDISLLKSCLDTCGTLACSISCSCRMATKGRRQCERSSRIRMTSCPGQRSGMSPRMTSCHPDLFLSAEVGMQRLSCVPPSCEAVRKERKVGDTQAGER